MLKFMVSSVYARRAPALRLRPQRNRRARVRWCRCSESRISAHLP
ncbi:hypothetical protein HMPREF0762_00275 [Slackia exigua ATCC 700122]|uniref:Uncharacterized protein n=1 Tax=Slackia exigua (strain ATCC 700122 / DSM 15923 / CIP 105133 / JCM 11022 / KCTC 5966 / S-7) TaxID=649764 RepID=D0WEP6_SLAES|nr:hypothetical protein HMPREF0762_00275 [Slackia exigua ATCC 700122]